MKKYLSVLIFLMLSIYIFLISIQTVHAQANITGIWEGVFMNDFRVLVNLSANDESAFEGNIKMFAGDDLIQDDKIEDISLTYKDFKFYIPAKETPFEGSFNDLLTELSGEFVFPDGSKHGIQLKRKITKTITHDEFRLLKEKKYDVQKLRSDLQFLYATLKEQHPQLYTFTSKDSIDLLFEKINNEINKPLSLEEFYLQTTKLTSAVKCSHTGVKLPSAYQNLMNGFVRYFPLKLFFTSGKAFYISGVTEGNHLLSPGDEVISINDKPIDKIIKQIFYFIPSEGWNTTTKYHEINKRFNTLYYLLDDSEEFIVKFKSGVSIENITISSSKLADIDSDHSAIENSKQVDFSYINKKSIGVLKVSSFAIPKMDHYFYQLDSIFGDLKTNNIRNLIIDLRDNSGGHPIFAAQLFSYLTEKDFVYFKRNEEIKDFEPLYNTMHPNKLNFNGNVFVFINGGCLSTTGHLISLMKFHTNVIFIGEEPGSTFRCNDFSMQLDLPNSGIVMNVPRTTFETKVTGFELCKPFTIDHKVNNKIIDVINKNDTYIEKVKTIYNK